MEYLTSRTMSSDEAHEWKSRISATANQLRLLLFEGYERQAWIALGHATWTECLQALAEEYRFSERRLWQLHAANQSEQLLNNCSGVGEIREGTLRPLTSLPPEEQREVWQEAVQRAPEGQPTAQIVQAVVDARQYTHTAATAETDEDLPAFLFTEGWSMRQRARAIERYRELPAELKPTVEALLGQFGISVPNRWTMLQHIATMDVDQQAELRRLQTSTDFYDRSCAIRMALDRPPPPHPSVMIVYDMRQELVLLRGRVESLIRRYPDAPETCELVPWGAQLAAWVQAVEAWIERRRG